VGVTLLVVVWVSGGLVATVRGVANIVVAPFSIGVDTVARPIGHFFAGSINYSDVVAQNQRLRYLLGRAETRANELYGLERQLQLLNAQNHVTFVGDLSTVMAPVTSLSPTNFSATFDVGVGRDQGVLPGMPVVANGGLIGRVIAATPHGATVRLISDTRSSLGVTFGVNEPSVIVTGRGAGEGLRATEIPLSSQIVPGTQLFTDGLNGGLYPAGIPVATVTKVTLTPGAATYDLTLRPIADLRHLAYVDVVLWEPST
jgi:rod shape-determining protein MreC